MGGMSAKSGVRRGPHRASAAAAERTDTTAAANNAYGDRTTVFVGTRFAGTRTEKKAEALARQILDDVIDNGLGPGTMLPPEAAMLDRYLVGRTTLREALRILEVHGLLVIHSGQGRG